VRENHGDFGLAREIIGLSWLNVTAISIYYDLEAVFVHNLVMN
tara:strand:- start:524 stop:652 length:129 start_codon:yes stop_codon:yes gene_type:complete